MKRNENGVVVPGAKDTFPLKIVKTHDQDGMAYWSVVDSTGLPLDSCDPDDAAFTYQALTFHERFAEIVRRFSEWHDQDDDTIDILPIVTDAAALWEEYQEQPK